MNLRAVLRQSAGDSGSVSNEVGKSRDRRRSKRRSLALTAPTSSLVTGELPVRILDISQAGLLIDAKSAELSVDDQIKVDLPECGQVTAHVAWKSGSFVGCQFSQLVSPAAISAALLKSDPQASGLSLATEHDSASRHPLPMEPELNFSIALLLAVVLWGLIGLAAYEAFT